MPADFGEKTEPPTPRRRNEAREKGQVARSQDLSAALLLTAAFLLMALMGPALWKSWLALMETGLAPADGISLEETSAYLRVVVIKAIRDIAPFLAVIVLVILAVSYIQVGPLMTTQPLTPNLSKINPLAGLKRLFSTRSLVAALMNLGKMAVVCMVGYAVISADVSAVLFSLMLSANEVVRLGASLSFRLALALSAAFLVLALLDYTWQRYRHERDLRMTKEEVKDELRSMEGDPVLKRRRRQLQMQLAMQRLRKDVPTADVVVTNPTHLAIALRYDADTMIAPKVVAKGADYVALRIRQIAQQCGIPIVERKPLAKALYETTEVGQYIPEKFYKAIAEILAYVYELTGKEPLRARS